jgi:hypothetical protein
VSEACADNRPLKAALDVGPADADLVLHDPRTGNTHRLNSVAAVTWQLCDGSRVPDTIASEVAACFAKPMAEVEEDVREILAEFSDAGLIVSSRASRPETDFLLRCVSRAVCGGCARASDDLEHENLDWSYVVQAALQHGVMPLLYSVVSRKPHGGVPPHILRRLRRSYRENVRANRIRFRELAEVLALLDAVAVDAIPLKGPALTLAAYGTLAARQFGDLDIFVRPQQMARAEAALASRGYTAGTHAETEHHWLSADGTISIDLQWALAPARFRFPFAAETFWARRRRVVLGGVLMWQPAPDDQLRFLCAHGAKHCWRSLGWIADIAALLRACDIDWVTALDSAARSGGERQLMLGLRLAAEVLGAAVPPGLAARVHDDGPAGALTAELRRKLFSAVEDPRRFQGSYDETTGSLLYMRTRERVRDKAPLAWELSRLAWKSLAAQKAAIVMPDDQDRAVVTLPDSIAFFYYLVRIGRLLKKYSVRLVSRPLAGYVSRASE